MYPAAFEYVAVRSFDEASHQLGRAGGEAKLLAGGCSLIPLMKLRLAEPRLLVDLNRIPDAAYVREDGATGQVRIGALTREADVESSPLLWRHWPILRDTSAVIADPLVRNMGTLGGNIAHADPANDHPAVMLAVEAAFVLRGGAGERQVAAGDFFQDLFMTALGEDEVLTEVRIPLPAAGTGSTYLKYERQVGDFAVAAVAVVVQVRDGVIRRARIGLTNVGAVPVRAIGTEAALEGLAADDAARIDDAAGLAADGIQPWADLRGGTEYKRDLVRGLTGRAVRRAVERALAGTGHATADARVARDAGEGTGR